MQRPHVVLREAEVRVLRGRNFPQRHHARGKLVTVIDVMTATRRVSRNPAAVYMRDAVLSSDQRKKAMRYPAFLCAASVRYISTCPIPRPRWLSATPIGPKRSAS